jgi:hypothetical protein
VEKLERLGFYPFHLPLAIQMNEDKKFLSTLYHSGKVNIQNVAHQSGAIPHIPESLTSDIFIDNILSF